MNVINPPNVNISQIVVDAGLDLSGGDYDIAMKAGRTIDGKDVSTLDIGDMLASLYRDNYIYDDFNDNLLTNRLRGLLGAKYRPEWVQVAGTTTFSSGKMIFNEAAESVKIPSTFTVGTWELTAIIDTGAADKLLHFYPIYVDATHYYKLAIGRSASAIFFNLQTKNGAGESDVIVGGAWADDTAEHIFKVTRDISGNFEIFQDGVSKGTGTDNNITTSAEIHLLDEGGTASQFNLLEVY